MAKNRENEKRGSYAQLFHGGKGLCSSNVRHYQILKLIMGRKRKDARVRNTTNSHSGLGTSYVQATGSSLKTKLKINNTKRDRRGGENKPGPAPQPECKVPPIKRK